MCGTSSSSQARRFGRLWTIAISQNAFTKLQSAAAEHGKPIYEALVQEHRARIAREREKADYAFAARRKIVRRIGLPEVRDYRMNLLAQEELAFHEQLELKAHAYPEMVPLLVIGWIAVAMSSWRDQMLKEFIPNVARLHHCGRPGRTPTRRRDSRSSP